MMFQSSSRCSILLVVAAVFTSFLLMSGVASEPATSSSKLFVHIPFSLRKAGGYDHKEALFGVPAYGGSIAQNVYYAAADNLCSPVVNTTGGYPTRPNGEPWPSPFILMVDRGDCTFVTKVRNAQRSGAAAVLIADTTCMCSDTTCISDQPCENTEPVMADDGSGADISIPSFLVYKTDADAFKQELVQHNQPIQVEMAWSLPAPDDRVEYDLWMTPSDHQSMNFLLNFKFIATALGERAFFSPHQYIYDGSLNNCMGANGENLCYNLCTNHGRYCATDPDGDLDKGISGADVVTESLRRLCIWEHYGSQDGIGLEWWNYLQLFNLHCTEAELFINPGCINFAMKKSGVDGAAIDSCMHDSGGLDQDVPNNKLDLEISKEKEQGVVVIPTAYVNTAPIRGALTEANVFNAICAGYPMGSKPTICQQCANCNDLMHCIQKGWCQTPTPSHGGHKNKKHNGAGEDDDEDGSNYSTEEEVNTMNRLSMVLIFSMTTMMVLGLWQYRRQTSDMRKHVRGILAEYMPLDDNGEPAMTMTMPASSPMDYAQEGQQTVALLSSSDGPSVMSGTDDDQLVM